MQTVTGKFNEAKVFTDVVDETSLEQIRTLCDQEFTSGAKIRKPCRKAIPTTT